MTGEPNNENNFPHRLLLSDGQDSKHRKAFANSLSTDIKLLKIQISKISQSGELLGRVLKPLLKTSLSFMKNVLNPLAKSVLIPLGLTVAVPTAVAGTHKKILSSRNTTLVISSE